MTFTYPAIITPHADGVGFHVTVPDLEGCEADGNDLDDSLEFAREAASDWIGVELEEFEGNLPFASDPEDLTLEEGQFIRMLLVTIKLLPDND